MPRKPLKVKKERARETVASWVHWRGTILRHCPTAGSPWTEEAAAEFYQDHKEEILREYLSMQRERKRPFQRPEEYWEELEAEHPRKRIGWEKWTGPMTKSGQRGEHKDPVYEDDKSYLLRLGLAEGWEESWPGNR